MDRTVQLSDAEPCSDLALLERIAAGIRALGQDIGPGVPTPGDQDLARDEFERAVGRFRSGDIEGSRDAE